MSIRLVNFLKHGPSIAILAVALASSIMGRRNMVKNILSRANTKIAISTAAALLATSYFASALLGLIRDRLLAAQFGLGGTLDAYFAAFSIPDLVFYLLVSGALAVTFIPVLSERIVTNNRKSAWQLSSSVLNFLALATFAASILIFIFADPLMWLVAPKFDAARHQTAVELTRILALNPFLFSISTVFASMQQAFGRFFFFALAPVIYNIGIIFGIVVLAPTYGIGGVALGAVAGAFLQMIIQPLGLIGIGFVYEPRIYWRHLGFRRVLKLMVPRSFDESIDQISAVVERAIASGLAVGSIASYQYAFNLKNMPITLIGTAIATAVFPKISRGVAAGRTDSVKRQINNSLSAMLWLIIPSAGLILILRGYVVRLLFGFGDPTTASILGWFAGAIIFQSILRLIARIFYSYQDTKTPLYLSILGLVLNIIGAIIFARIFGIKGLAMAQSIAVAIEVTILLFILRRRIGRFVEAGFSRVVLRIMVAAALTMGVCYLLVRYPFPLLSTMTGFWALAPKFFVIGLASAITYIGVGYQLGLSEAEIVVNKISRFVFKRLSPQ